LYTLVGNGFCEFCLKIMPKPFCCGNGFCELYSETILLWKWFFQSVDLNDFLVRSFLHFRYEVSFEALDKGAIEILGPYGISHTFRRLAEWICCAKSALWPVVACLVWWGPPLWVNGKPDSTNPRKGCTAVVGAWRPELLVVLAWMQVNESHPLASEVLTPL